MESENENNGRRKFLKFGLLAGGATIASIGIQKNLLSEEKPLTGKKVKVLTADGHLVEVDSSHVEHHASNDPYTAEEIRKGVEGRKFIRVIDLSRCANERKCVEGCQKAHKILAPVEYLKVKRMQDSELTSPYWMPTMCFHCDNPPCTKVCPVDATFKRTDGIVAIDNDRCIGCKFCMAACPYSARTFNFGRPEQKKFTEANKDSIPDNYCRTSYAQEGTVAKCDFCTSRCEQGLLPACVVECPNGAIFHGDELEDTVTNGEDTFRLTELLRSRAGYRLFEELGTKPRVYYLPPVKRQFPFEEATEAHNTQE
jgi:Fe-S-cluster-containing dehydrogenase component